MKFNVSAFADEYSAKLDEQIIGLNKCGIGYIEIRGVDGKNVSSLTEAEAKETAAKLAAGGIKTSAIGSPIGKIGINEAFEPHLEQLKRTIETAHILDTKLIRMFSFFIPKGEAPESYRTQVMERLGAMLEIADNEGIILCHENEADIYGESPECCLDIANTFNDRIKTIFDPANYLRMGHATKPGAYDLLKDRIYYMHIKDAGADGTIIPAGKGLGAIPEILGELNKRDGEMFLTLEPHLKVFAGFSDLERDNVSHIEGAYATNEEAFTAASEALFGILNNL